MSNTRYGLARPWILICGIVFAQIIACATIVAAPPKVTWLYPSGGTRGKTTNVQLGGSVGTWPLQATLHPPDGVKITASKTKGTIEVIVDPTAAPGTRWLRLYNSEGASTLRPFVIGTLPEVAEKETNDNEPQVLANSVVVNGKLGKRGDVDTYRFALKKGDTLVAALDAHRTLGSPMDASLQTANERGFVLQEVDDTCGLDPRIIHTATRDGTVILRAFAFPAQPSSSISYAGGEDYIYRLTVTSEGFVDHALPMALNRAATNKVTLHGWNLPGKQIVQQVKPDESSRDVLVFHPQSANPMELPVGDAPVYLSGSATSPVMAPPFVASGRLGAAKSVARIRFKAAKGKTLRLSVASRSLGYPLDAVLKIQDANGKILSEKDDASRDERDPRIDFKPPADGEYVVAISDLHDRGGFRYVYRLTVDPVVANFALAVEAGMFVGTAGKPLKLPVKIARQDGFAGTITIQAEGLPKHIKANAVESKSKGATAKAVTLELTNNGATWSGPVRIVGQAKGLRSQQAMFKTTVPDKEHHAVWLTIPGKKN